MLCTSFYKKSSRRVITSLLIFPTHKKNKHSETIYGVQTIMYTMLDDHVTEQSGDYFNECAREELWDHAKDERKGAELWSKSAEWVRLSDHE